MKDTNCGAQLVNPKKQENIKRWLDSDFFPDPHHDVTTIILVAGVCSFGLATCSFLRVLINDGDIESTGMKLGVVKIFKI